MTRTIAIVADRLHDMGKKKQSGGKHKTIRINVGVPEEWHSVMRKLAAKSKMPVLWYLIDLASREAEIADIDTPMLPWVEEDIAGRS